MTNKHDMAAGHEATSDTAASDATWHPFNVWRNQVKPSAAAGEAPLLAARDTIATRDWDPFSVWKKQVKRN